MQIKELYEYNQIVLDCIEDQDFLELELDDEYKIPLEKLAEYYSVDLDIDQNRYGHAFDICKKILGHHDELNDIAYRAVSYLTRNLIPPNKLIELYLDKYKTINNLNNYEDINTNDFINYMSDSLELSRDFIRINLEFLDVIQ
jgi:hypothetical protein